MAGRVARVLPEVAALDRPFDYEVGADGEVVVGDRVRVSFHGRSVRGWVVEVTERSEHTELKPIARRLGIGPSQEVVELTRWAAWRWAGAWSKLLASASPSTVVPARISPVPPRTEPEVHNLARVEALRLVRQSGRALVHVGPCTDPIDLVLGVLRGLADEAVEGTLIVTTPTTGWAERLAERIRRRGVAVAGPGQWAEAASGWPVVVDTRSGALASVPTVAAAIVLDAHDGAYRQTQAPCWNAVGLLAARCATSGATMLATSWCADPSLRSLFDREVELDHSARMWPRVTVADLSVADPRERHLSSRFVDAAHRALAERTRGVAVVVVLQRLGGARRMMCTKCGTLAVCEAHGSVLVERDGAYGCALGCAGLARICVACGSAKLVVLREGISALATRCAALLGVEVTEVSATTAPLPEDARVVVGTEAALSRVRHAGLVCFADLDDYLCAPRAHGALDALRAIGLAGRLVGARGASDPGMVLVQTRLAHHAVVAAAVQGHTLPVLDVESRSALELSLPPHVAVCALHGEGARSYAEALHAAGLTVTASADRVLVEAPTHELLCDALAATARPAGALRVEVDPPDV